MWGWGGVYGCKSRLFNFRGNFKKSHSLATGPSCRDGFTRRLQAADPRNLHFQSFKHCWPKHRNSCGDLLSLSLLAREVYPRLMPGLLAGIQRGEKVKVRAQPGAAPLS